MPVTKCRRLVGVVCLLGGNLSITDGSVDTTLCDAGSLFNLKATFVHSSINRLFSFPKPHLCLTIVSCFIGGARVQS